MIEDDYRSIPDLRYTVDLLVCQEATVASRLWFDCSPAGEFLGIAVNGQRVSFA